MELERERKAALMEYLFTHGTRGESLKQTEIGEMPESWEVVKLGQLASVKGGKRLPKGEPLVSYNTGQPYIRAGNLKNGTVTINELLYVPDHLKKVVKNYTVASGDVYITIVGAYIGDVGIIPDLLDGANLTENAAKLIINSSNLLDNHFLAKYLDTKVAQFQIKSLTTRTSQPKLALSRIEQILISLPFLREQKEIVSVLNACAIKISSLEQEIVLLGELFQAMLEELMTGRLSAIPLIEE